MTENKDVPEGFGYSVIYKAALIYKYYGLVASTNPVRLQWDFDVLIGILKQAGLHTNVSNMVTMVCQTRNIYGKQTIAASRRQITDEGEYRQMRQRQRVVCE